jgi:hypothetical protein
MSRPRNEQLVAYTDETGHTGPDVFNVEQPYLRTLTLISAKDVDVAAGPTVEDCKCSLGMKRLHASEMKLDGVEQIAERLRLYIEQSDRNRAAKAVSVNQGTETNSAEAGNRADLQEWSRAA